jgi:Cu(I)/Ag(I) efflux system protein CusF
MKVIALIAVAALILPAGTVLAQAGSMNNADTKAPPAKKVSSPIYTATGVVKKVDAANGTVTLAHGPVKELNWPAMTMQFAVRNKALLGKLVIDRKIEFTFVQDGSSYIVTAVK